MIIGQVMDFRIYAMNVAHRIALAQRSLLLMQGGCPPKLTELGTKTLRPARIMRIDFFTRLTKVMTGYDFGNAANYRKFGREFPPPDITDGSVELVLIPVHYDVHFTLMVLDLSHKALQWYDSLHVPLNAKGRFAMDYVLRWVMDEHAANGKASDIRDWSTHVYSTVVPKQTNGVDCGFFTLEFARCILTGHPWDFGQDDIPVVRRGSHWTSSLADGQQPLQQTWPMTAAMMGPCTH